MATPTENLQQALEHARWALGPACGALEPSGVPCRLCATAPQRALEELVAAVAEYLAAERP